MSYDEKVKAILKSVSEAAIPQLDITCPNCEQRFTIARKAVFQDNILTTAITMAEGHILQASTLAGHMASMSKLMKAVAKESDWKIDVMVTDVRFHGRTIEIDFASLSIEESETGEKP